MFLPASDLMNRWLPLFAVTGLLAACSTGSPTPTTTGSQAADSAPLVACTTLFRDGATVPLTAQGVACRLPDGRAWTASLVICVDGVHQAGQVQPGFGIPTGWFVAPGTFHAVKGDLTRDAAYQRAYQDCVGGAQSS